jgi:hypothetical protein
VVVIPPVVTPPLVTAPVIAPLVAAPVLTAIIAAPQGWDLAVNQGGLLMPMAEPLEELQTPVLAAVEVPDVLLAPVRPAPLPVYPRKQDRN